MQANRETLFCRYRYDPLDRLVASTPSAQADTQRFYLKDRLATEIHGAVQRSIVQHENQLLAQQQRRNEAVETSLLATDQQRSVLNLLTAAGLHPLSYTPYGHRPSENGLLSLLGFNGERRDPVTGHYLLGNGYRAFNPVLMRFNSPDSWSPFGEGGLNTYVYGEGDSVNRVDPTGHAPIVSRIFSYFSRSGSLKSSLLKKAHSIDSTSSTGTVSSSINKVATNISTADNSLPLGHSNLAGNIKSTSTADTLHSAVEALQSAKSLRYKGRKLAPLKKASSHLKKYYEKRELKIEKYEQQHLALEEFNIVSSDVLPTATELYEQKLGKLQNIVDSRTSILNEKLRIIRS